MRGKLKWWGWLYRVEGSLSEYEKSANHHHEKVVKYTQMLKQVKKELNEL